MTNQSGVIENLEASKQKLQEMVGQIGEMISSLKSGGVVASGPRPARQAALPTRPSRKGSVSMRQAALVTLYESGTALHVEQVLKKAQTMGAVSEAADPIEAVDLLLYKLKKRGVPVEKTAPRTWRWIPGAEPQQWVIDVSQ